MKINDIIVEGPIWDGIKGAYAGAKAGYQQSKQQAATDAASKEMAQRYTTQWLNIAKNNPAANASNLQAFVQKLNIGTEIPPFKGAINDPAGVEKYISQGFALAQTPGSTTPAAAPAQQANQSYAGASEPASDKISIGGQELDPNDPVSAKIIAQFNQQQAAATPAATEPAAAPTAAAPAQTPEQIRIAKQAAATAAAQQQMTPKPTPVSYTHLRGHETG
jgi:hypothetical protein